MHTTAGLNTLRASNVLHVLHALLCCTVLLYCCTCSTYESLLSAAQVAVTGMGSHQNGLLLVVDQINRGFLNESKGPIGDATGRQSNWPHANKSHKYGRLEMAATQKEK
jgi:photosystem II stability/assembly factor-like uncharacterized protein